MALISAKGFYKAEECLRLNNPQTNSTPTKQRDFLKNYLLDQVQVDSPKTIVLDKTATYSIDFVDQNNFVYRIYLTRKIQPEMLAEGGNA